MNAGLRAATGASQRFARSDNGGPGGHGNGQWVFAGPSEALYPFEPLRNWSNYVPNTYVAAGRTTAIAIDDRCNKHCTAYVTAAGGGIWRTNDVFANNVNWDYVGGPLGINAAGAVSFDPN